MLTEEQVGAVLSYEELIPVIRQALMDFSAGRVRHLCAILFRRPSMAGGSG